MPNILPPTLPAAPAKANAAGAVDPSSSYSRANRSRKTSESRGGFGDALSGARRKKDAAAASGADSAAEADRKAERSSAGGKKRAETSTDRAKRRESSEAGE